MGEIHPIEARSYEILASRVNLTRWPTGARQVVARMIHATADESFAQSVRIGVRAVDAAVAALRVQAPVVCDARMVVAGIPKAPAVCYLDRAPAAGPFPTRSAAAMARAAADHPSGAVWIIGNAPTALAELLRLHRAGRLQPAVVIGLPVGYVGAAEAKADLWGSPLGELSITNSGPRGGSPVAAAAMNALLRLADDPYSAPR